MNTALLTILNASITETSELCLCHNNPRDSWVQDQALKQNAPCGEQGRKTKSLKSERMLAS